MADINLDYLRPIFPLKILTTLALDESTLGDAVRKTAAPMGIQIREDKEPERGLFRSRINIISSGLAFRVWPSSSDTMTGSPEEAVYRHWYAERYHKPSDDIHQPMTGRPREKFNDFFGRLVKMLQMLRKSLRFSATSPYGKALGR